MASSRHIKKRISNHEDLQETKLSDTSTTNVFSIDYSIRGTAKCKTCKLPIAKSVLRIAKLVPFKTTIIKQFRHVECAFNSFRRAKSRDNIPGSSDDLDGFENISNSDQQIISAKFINMQTIIQKLNNKMNATQQNRNKISERNVPDKAKKPKSITESKDCVEPKLKIMYTNADQLTVKKWTS